MSLAVLKTYKIRLLILSVIIILLTTLLLSLNNFTPHQTQSFLRVLQNSPSKQNENIPVNRTYLRKSTTSFAPLLEISEAINSFHQEEPLLESLHHKSFPCDDIRPSSAKFTQRGNFWALSNFIKSRKTFHCYESITYTTHAEYPYLISNLGPLLKRWQGPVSLAVYVPGPDFAASLKRLIYLRKCDEEVRHLVQDFLSVHFFFDHDHPPDPLSPEFEQILFSQEAEVNCSHPIFQDIFATNQGKSYRSSNNLPYPINVGRNIAKELATTRYLLPSDIELYPSPGLVPDFLAMIGKSPQSYEGRKVFVLPIFEVDGSLSADQLPQDKVQLVDLLKRKLAVPFHFRICPRCHNIPRAEEWTQQEVGEGLRVFHVATRNGSQSNWEPIYIGTKDEPGYDERLNWEGLKDKMSQGSLLCTLEYEMHILDNAFLVHSPGIKRKGPSGDAGRKKFISKQTQVLKRKIMPELRLLYGNKKGC